VFGAVVSDARVVAWLWPHTPAPAPEELLERFSHHWDEHGYGPWVFREQATDEPIGYGGLHITEVEGVPETEVLYAVASGRWGEGFATEIARKSVRAARELGIEGLVCMTRTDNAASRRVMEKAGFRYEREFERVGLTHALHRLE
jgi:ribosomal-protein-alanine N-acetyltransferase